MESPADLLSSKDPEIQNLVKDSSFITIDPNSGKVVLAPANILPTDYDDERQDLKSRYRSGQMSIQDYTAKVQELDEAELNDADSVITMTAWTGDIDAR